MATKYLSIDTVVGETNWSIYLKKSMIQDFVKSGFGNVALLIGADAKETSKNIQSEVNGFSSGKNTYLQANQLAEIIHSMSSSRPRRYYKRKTQTDASQDGDVLKDCSGWTITKKNLEDGRIVYNANIKAETPKNKGDWATIKGEVYVETTFKWNFKFQNFERWGQIENESEIIEKLCQVLSKYYEGGEKPAPAPAPQSTTLKEGDKFKMYGRVYEINRILEGRVFYNPVDDEMAERDVTISEAEKEIANGIWVKIEDEEEETPTPEAPKSKEENSIPANPKLDYCRINWAEGYPEYADKFPKDFSSFTELTKYIAKNIKALPKKGYDKHGVEWKWKFEEQEHTDRWDVSESEANPFKYPNLYASEKMQTLCYYAWYNETDEVTTFKESDDFIAEMLGKEGFELNDEQFNAILKLYLTLYKQDTKRFKYNTPEERIERFKEVYPKTYKLFNSGGQAKSKQDIEKAIKGLQFLADKGNEKAKKAIIGLKILLNK